MKKFCQHCSENKINRPRQLCWQCYYIKGIRDLYPPKVNGVTGAKVRKGRKEEDPTEAELDKMIAEQLPTMPPDERPKSKKEHWVPPVMHSPHKVTMKMRATSHRFLL